eukprot:474568-Pelagomonas_calceolata.AAC.1
MPCNRLSLACTCRCINALDYDIGVREAVAVFLLMSLEGAALNKFVCALAYDLGVPEDRAVTIIVAATAAATRARLLDVSVSYGELRGATPAATRARLP